MPKRAYWFLSILMAAVVLTAYGTDWTILRRLETLSRETRFHWRGPLPAGPEIAVAAIDEKSIDELGRWPWPRLVIANLIDKLVENEAAVIGLDIVFSSPEESSSLKDFTAIRSRLENSGVKAPALKDELDRKIKNADRDARLAQSFRNAGNVVMGYFFHHNPNAVKHLSTVARKAGLQTILKSRFAGFIKSGNDLDLQSIPFRSAWAVESNIPILSSAAGSHGFISFDAGSDGSIRALPLAVRMNDPVTGEFHAFPPFSIRVLEKYLDGALLFRVNERGLENILLDADKPVEIPADKSGRMYINFPGPGGTFPHYSITDILEDKIPGEKLKDKIILVGASAGALEDLRATPFDPVLPGVEIHAAVIDNILRENFIRQPDWLPVVNTGLLILLPLVMTPAYGKAKALLAPAFWAGAALALWLVGQWVFESHRVWLPDVYLQLENLLIFAAITIHRYRTEEKQKRYIQSIFGQYLSPAVIDQLLKNPGALKLGGEEKELTALFTDIAGFSSFSEKLNPTELVSLLNRYLTEMTDVLLKHEGTLDKYDGDAIKAFFGAPVYFRDHARRACMVCMVCIEMQEKAKQFRAQCRKEGKPEIFMRVGVNTGSMLIGNFGSRNRMNYGMNGDSVNLAARLEPVNKIYGTDSIISESTFLQARDFIEVRELDIIRVLGRRDPVKIYQLLGRSGEMEPGLKKALPDYLDGLERYKARQWKEAAEQFGKVLTRIEDDPSKVLLERCRTFIENPPPDHWDGVYDVSIK